MSYLLLPRKIPCQLSHSCLSLAYSSSLMLDIIKIKTRSFVPSDGVNGNLRSLSYGSLLCSCLSLPYGHHHYHLAKAALRATRPNRRDRGAKIRFKRVHYGVFSTSRFAPLALSSDWTFSQLVPTDPLGVVMIFYVLWPHGGPTNLRG